MFNPWVGKIPWRKEWQLTPIFLPGESHGQRSLAGYSPGVTKSQTRLSDQHFHFQEGLYFHLRASSLSSVLQTSLIKVMQGHGQRS